MTRRESEIPIEDWEVLDLLTSLVDKSLVVYEEQPDGTGRYRLLETVRQYAVDRLEESGEEEVIQNAHLSWCVALAEEAYQQGRRPDMAAWLSRLAAEHDNLRAGLAWGFSPQEHFRGEPLNEHDLRFANEDGLHLAASLCWFWVSRGHLSEGRRWLGLALARAEASGGEESVGRAEILVEAGTMARSQGDYAEARALLEESLALFHQSGDQWGLAWTLNYLGDVVRSQGDYAEARALLEESLALFHQSGARPGVAWALNYLGLVAYRQSQMERSARLSGAASSLRESIGNALPPVEQEEVDAMLASAAEALGEVAFAAAWDAGQAMTLDAAIEYALTAAPEDTQ